MKQRSRSFSLLVLLVCNLSFDIPAQNESHSTGIPATVESRRTALAELRTEQQRLRSLNNVAGLVRIDNRIGELQLKVRDLGAAKVTADESLALARKLAGPENEPLLVDSLIFSARVHIHNNLNREAILLLNEARARSSNHKYERGEAQSWTQLGLAYSQLFELQAEQAHAQAIEIWRRLKDKRGEARALTNQGETYMLSDQPSEANESLRKAEVLWREIGDPIELATTLIDLNFLAIRQGQWQLALSLLGEANQLVTDVDAEPYLAGQIATSFGEVHEAYAQLNTALSYFQAAVALYKDRAHDQAATIDATSKAGRVQARLGDYDGATQQISEGLKLAREIGDPLRLGLCHEELGKIWLTAGANEQARQEFISAIAFFERAGQRRPWARTQALLGQTQFVAGNLGRASEAYRKALTFFQGVRDYNNEAAVSFGMGKLALAQNEMQEAGKLLQRSIELTEQLRENASSKDLRSSFLASVHDRYETYVEWLMTRHEEEPGKGFDVKAFEASESVAPARYLIPFETISASCVRLLILRFYWSKKSC